MRKQYRKQKKNNFFMLTVIFVCFITIVAYKVITTVQNFKQIPVEQYRTNLDFKHENTVLEDTILEGEISPVINDANMIYIPLDVIKKQVDQYIFWDAEEQKVIITTPFKVYQFEIGQLNYKENDRVSTLKTPFRVFGKEPYLPQDFLTEFYKLDIHIVEAHHFVTIDFLTENKIKGKVVPKKCNLRYEPNKKSPIEKKLVEGESLVIYEQSGEYTKVRTEDALIGYVLTKNITKTEEIKGIEKNVESSPPLKPTSTGKLNVVWDQILKVEQNQNPSKLIARKGLDVLSPTWFSVSDEQGNIKSIADKAYVDWAHANNIKVWGLLDNNGFDGELTHKFLSKTKVREKIIANIVALAKQNNVDGINIDFESVKKEDGMYYVEFIRELSPILRENGLVVSVDMYVPKEWTSHYGREDISKVIDYLMVMAYDEHWSTSTESGSVASINWVTEGLENTIKTTPKEKIILGVPYYTRLWKEKLENGEVTVKSEAYGMQAGANILNDHKVNVVWDEATGQYYGSYEKDDTTYKMWLEDERSIALKASLVEKYDIAGVSGWKRGLEKEVVWDTLYQVLKK